MGILPKLLPFWPDRLSKKGSAHAIRALDAIAEVDSIWVMEPRAAQSARNALERLDLSAHAEEFAATAACENGQGSASDDVDYVVDDDGIACICVSGVLTKRPVSWGRNTSTVLLRRSIRKAAGDPKVNAIAIVIDSPGGQAAGTADLAADVKAARGSKKVGAYIEDMGCSGAYWIASQADFVGCNATAEVGSIGTLLVVEDSSEANAKAGIKTHVIGSGWMKGVGTTGTPIDDRQLGDLKRELDEVNSEFLQSVSEARGIDVADLLGFEARVFVGKNAVQKKLADGVMSIDAFFDRLRNEAGAKNAKSSEGAKSMAICECESQEEIRTFVPINGVFEVCRERGIETAEELREELKRAELGRRYEAEIRADAKTQAVRAYGAELGLTLVSSCENLPAESVASLRDGWKAEADAKFGAGASRRSAPIALMSSENGGEHMWTRLSDEQKLFAQKMGITGEAEREQFASLYLGAAKDE